MDKAGATGYCIIRLANFHDYVHLSGEYVTYSGNRYFVEWVDKEVNIMNVTENVGSMLSQAGIPRYWDYITEDGHVIKAWYYDFEDGEMQYDIFKFDGVQVYRKLKGMPYDKNGRHATGWELWKQTTFGGLWEYQYEGEEE